MSLKTVITAAVYLCSDTAPGFPVSVLTVTKKSGFHRRDVSRMKVTEKEEIGNPVCHSDKN
jgi:hypothetical protein